MFDPCRSEDSGQAIALVRQARRPLVVINRRPVHAEFSSVSVDFFGAGVRAAKYLLRLGHRLIALWIGHETWPARQIHAGMARELSKQGLNPVHDPKEVPDLGNRFHITHPGVTVGPPPGLNASSRPAPRESREEQDR